MKRRLTRWLMPILRYGLCVAAILYLVHIVHWYNYARLNDTDQTRVRILELNEDDNTIVILRDGKRTTIPIDPQHLNYVADGTVPDITFGISGVVRRMDVNTALLAILIFLPVPILQSIRLVWMVAVQDVRLSYWSSFKLSFAGNFFNFAMPGFFGGDLIKAYYVTRFTHRKTEAVTTVFLDRVVGLIGLMMVATGTFIGSVVSERIQWDPQLYRALTTALVLIWGGLAVGCVVLFSHRLRHLIKLPAIAKKLPAAGQILRIGRAMVKMRRRKGLVILSLANTVILQLLVVIAAYQMSRALHMQGTFDLYFIGVPIGFLVVALPILPPQGLGVMEYVYVLFFTRGGLNPNSAAVAFALANRLTQLVWALPGVLVPLLGAHLPSEAELQALEEPESEELPDPTDGKDDTPSAGPTSAAPSK